MCVLCDINSTLVKDVPWLFFVAHLGVRQSLVVHRRSTRILRDLKETMGMGMNSRP